jgi:hypothetical protein
VKTEKSWGVKRRTLEPSDWFGFPLSKNPHHQPFKNQTVQPADAFENTAFKPGVEIVKF